jgi:ribosome-binding protein aMBF1 (putative translation factor)
MRSKGTVLSDSYENPTRLCVVLRLPVFGIPIIKGFMSMAIDTKLAASLGDNIRDAREKAELGLRELARKAGISPSYLSEIESGISIPGSVILQRISKALRVSVARLWPAE